MSASQATSVTVLRSQASRSFGWRAQRRQERGEQDVGVEDEAHHDRLARSVVFRADVFDGLVNHLLELVRETSAKALRASRTV